MARIVRCLLSVMEPIVNDHHDKLSDIGGRVARVAHELNVPLSLITGSLETLEQYTGALLRYVEASAEHVRDSRLDRLETELNLPYVIENAPTLLAVCREGTRRLGHVIQQLRLYSRRPADSVRTVVNLGAIVTEAVRLAAHGREPQPVIDQDVSLLLPVSGVAESLCQALVNILVNALDAVAGRADPHVWVTGHFRPGGRDPETIEVRIRDNGPGIPPALRSHVFAPFFTTKTQSSGMGLGLAIAKEIIDRHDGTIEIVDSATPGTTFAIRLPAQTFARTEAGYDEC